MKLYQIRSDISLEIEKVEAAGFYHAAQVYCMKAFGKETAIADRITGESGAAGYFWARFIGTDRYIGQPFKVEEIE